MRYVFHPYLVNSYISNMLREKIFYLWLTGVLTIVYMVIAVGAHSLDSLLSGKVHPRWSQREMWINFNLSEIMEAVPIIMFAFTCQVLTWVIA